MNAYEQIRAAITKAEAVIDGTRMMVLQGQEYDLGLLDFDGALKMLRAALDLPRRNCDVGTASEQEERYLKLKREHVDRMARCPAVGQSFFFPDSLYWAQMQYEEKKEGATDGV